MRFAQVILLFRNSFKGETKHYRITLSLKHPLFSCIPAEEPAERQGPSEHAAVQHADAAKECQAEGEVRASVTSILYLCWSVRMCCRQIGLVTATESTRANSEKEFWGTSSPMFH